MTRLLALCSLCLLTHSVYPENISFYKSQISFLYLYFNHVNLIHEAWEKEIWTDEKAVKNLKTSLSLIQGRLQDYQKSKPHPRAKELHNSIKHCFHLSIQTTNLIISGLEDKRKDWQSRYIPLKNKWQQRILDLTEMEE